MQVEGCKGGFGCWVGLHLRFHCCSPVAVRDTGVSNPPAHAAAPLLPPMSLPFSLQREDKERAKARKAAGKQAKPLWQEDGKRRGLLDKYDEEEEQMMEVGCRICCAVCRGTISCLPLTRCWLSVTMGAARALCTCETRSVGASRGCLPGMSAHARHLPAPILIRSWMMRVHWRPPGRSGKKRFAPAWRQVGCLQVVAGFTSFVSGHPLWLAFPRPGPAPPCLCTERLCAALSRRVRTGS